MSLGVLNNLSAIYAENNLNSTNNSLTTVLQQLSSGSKINSGADDAAGLSMVDGLKANSMALAQSQTNASEGVGLLTVADGALSQVTNLLNRAVTLATEASNGTLNSSQDSAANSEYQSILSEINNIGTTTTYNNQTVFGAASPVNIYTGDSSNAGASIDSLNIQALSSSNVGDTGGIMAYSNGSNNVFLNLSSSTANAAVGDQLNLSGTTTLNVNYLVKGGNGASTTASTTITAGGASGYQNTAAGLISAINNAGLGLNATFTTQDGAGVQGGGTQTGIEIAGGLVSAGVDPSASITSGVLNSSGIPASQLLTNGQQVTVSEGGTQKATVTIGTTANVSGGGFVNTLTELAASINQQAGAGTASVVTNGDGTQSLALQDNGPSQGALTVATQGGANVAPAFAGAVAGSATRDVQTATSVSGVQSAPAVASKLTVGATATATATTGNPVDPNTTVLSEGGAITIQNTIPNNTTSMQFVVGFGTDVTAGANQVYYTANSGDDSNTLANLVSVINAKGGTALDLTASVNPTGGLVLTAKTSNTSENITATANTLSTATNTIGLYTPEEAATGEFATAIMQLGSADPLSSTGIGAGDKLTGSFTLTNNAVSSTYVIGTGTNGAGVFYTNTTSETAANLATFINANQTASMNLVANAPGGGTGGIYLQASVVMGGAVTTGISMTASAVVGVSPLADSVAMSGAGNSTAVTGQTQVAGNAGALTVGPSGVLTVDTSDVLSAASSHNSIAITNGGVTDTFYVGAGADVTTGAARSYYTANNGDGTNTLENLATTINVDTGHSSVQAVASTAGLVLTQSQSAGNYTGGNITAVSTLTDNSKGTYSTDSITGFASANDTVSGTIDFSIGTGTLTPHTFTATTGETVTQMVADINKNSTSGLDLGVSATQVNGLNGAVSVLLQSLTEGTAGSITPNAAAISTLADTTSTANLSYKASAAYNMGLSSTSGVADQTTSQSAATFAADQKSASGVATISYSDGAGQSLSASDLTNQTDAQASLKALNSAITDVAAQDGYIGAQINTLNAVSSVLSTQQENVTAAQNAVQATDYASATSNMSKYEILSQTGISALAQANSMQQEVTKLLQ